MDRSMFIYVTVYRWLTVNEQGDGGRGVFLFPWQLGPWCSRGPGSGANTNHTEHVVLSAAPWLAGWRRSGLRLTPWVVWPCECL